MGDPNALLNSDLSVESDGDSVDEYQLRKIHEDKVRLECSTLKMVAFAVGMAYAQKEHVTADDIPAVVRSILERVESLRKMVLSVFLNIDQDDKNYNLIFNSITASMMDVVFEEFKWQKILNNTESLSYPLIGKIIDEVGKIKHVHNATEYPTETLDVTRKLSALEITPKVWGLVNLFDFFCPENDRPTMIMKLVQQIAGIAEWYTDLLTPPDSPIFAKKAILQRTYKITVGIFCEVYKHESMKKTLELKTLPDLERGLLLERSTQGLPYDHVLERFSEAMQLMYEQTNLILEQL